MSSATSPMIAPAVASPMLAAQRAPAIASTTRPAGSGMNMEAARKTAQDFEAVFVGQMVQLMFSNVETGSVFGGGEQEKMYRSMMQDEYGRTIAKSGGIGIADAVMRQMLKMQEGKR